MADKNKLSKKEQRELEKKNRIAKGQAAAKINQEKQRAVNTENDSDALQQESNIKIPRLKPRDRESDIPLYTGNNADIKEGKPNNIQYRDFTLKVTALSPLHLGSGQADVNVDAEVIHDELGLPYFPAKRLKGLIYESALEVTEMNTPLGSGESLRQELDLLFHHGSQGKAQLIIPNLYLENYDEMKMDWEYLQQKYKEMFTPMDVLSNTHLCATRRK